jgi:hypothetical protein
MPDTNSCQLNERQASKASHPSKGAAEITALWRQGDLLLLVLLVLLGLGVAARVGFLFTACPCPC